MTEEPDRFKEILEEIFDIKIELIQAFSDLGKKFDNLINARAFFQSEQPPTLIGIPDVPVKKESTKNGKVTEKVESKLVIEHEGRTYRKFEPCKYKCGYWASWADDYKKGDHKFHINPATKEIIGECPEYE